MMTTRRRFIGSVAGASAALAVGGWTRADDEPHAWPIAVFEKVFEKLTYDELAEAVARTGADGIEATIRPGGHIRPGAAADETPRMAEALRKRGKRILIAATAIRSADSPHAESLLETFRSLGIRHYRLGYYRFDAARPLRPQVAEARAQLRTLVALNREFGLQGLYQNHAGARYLGALGWDAAELFDGIDPDAVGIALDLRHLRADTGTSWKTAAALLKPHIRSIYVKDATWTGPRGNVLRDVPLDSGFVNREVFAFVRGGLRPMPICLHVEHLGYRAFEKHEMPEVIQAHRADLAVLRKWLRGQGG
jgi:sugar phosphate isomerase/epimerase